MNIYHVLALLIAALLVLICGLSNTCTHDALPQIIQLAGCIVGGVMGLARGGGVKRRPKLSFRKKAPNDRDV